MTDYHSVYLASSGSMPQTRYAIGDSVAFVHDVMAGPLPIEYADCDVIYADLPWRAGFAHYNDRAGVADDRTYRDFLAAVRDVIETRTVPAVIVTGRHALDSLPKPSQVLPVIMPVANGQPGVALVYGMALISEWPKRGTPDGLLALLAATNRCVGDFCCGYGASAYAFLRAGRRFVASDYNPECIGYIAKNVGRWM